MGGNTQRYQKALVATDKITRLHGGEKSQLPLTTQTSEPETVGNPSLCEDEQETLPPMA